MINISAINNSWNTVRFVNYTPLAALKNLFHARPASDLDIPASSYVSAYLPIIPVKLFLSLKRIREYVSRSLLHQASSSEREDNGAWVEAMCRGVAEYVGSLRVVVTSDGHTMLIPRDFQSNRHASFWEIKYGSPWGFQDLYKLTRLF